MNSFFGTGLNQIQHEEKESNRSFSFLYQQNIDSILSDKKVLLPPPDPKDSHGEYELGSVIYDNRKIGKFGLREKEFLRHLGLFRITGTGKSNVVFKLIDELIRHMS